MEERRIEAVYASDERFLPVLLASAESLFTENTENPVRLHILSDGISEGGKEKLSRLAERFHQELCFYPLTEESFRGDAFHLTKDWPRAAVARLRIEKILPESLERVLYLDCDTMVRGDLSPLFSMDMKGMWAGGVCECMDENYLRSLGLSGGGCYINSGVILYELSACRREKLSERLGALMEGPAKRYKYPDQDAINVSMQGHILSLPFRTNLLSQPLAFSFRDYERYRDGRLPYSEREYEEAKKDPLIVHFAGGFAYARPWYQNCRHPYREEFLQYYRRNGGENFGRDNRNKKQRLVALLFALPLPFLKLPLLRLLRRRNNRQHGKRRA